MSEVQATVEFSVELHKFYNVDLFQRGNGHCGTDKEFGKVHGGDAVGDSQAAGEQLETETRAGAARTAAFGADVPRARGGGAAVPRARGGGAATARARGGGAAAARARGRGAAAARVRGGGDEEPAATTEPTTTPAVQSGAAGCGPSPLAPVHPSDLLGPPFARPGAQESAEPVTVLHLVPCSAPPKHQDVAALLPDVA
ncbi:UNVERIFIED_CONTAM: hypothetical protein FKN15_076486 [Acipenser sinensis]